MLPREFFARPSVVVAPDLLGCVIMHETSEGPVAVELTEVEAYAGEADPASHAFRGRTARNAVMFGPPGHVYVYFTYGMHFCMNLVCRQEVGASAVLLRAGRVIEGVPLARARRSGAARPADASGSGGVGSSGTGGSGAAGSSGGDGSGGAGSSGRSVEADTAGRSAADGQQRSRRLARAAPREIDLARGPARLCQALGVDLSHDGADASDPASPLRAFAALKRIPPGGISRGPRVGVSRAADVPWRFWITGDPAVSPYRAYAPRRAGAKSVTSPEREGGTIPQ
jgi:DNA-3-methyladenine glycosylase